MTRYYLLRYTVGMKDISIVTAKVPTDLKDEAQEIAEALGVSLSSIIKNALQEFVKEKKISYELTPEAASAIAEARAEYERGETIGFPAEEAVEGLRRLLETEEFNDED